MPADDLVQSAVFDRLFEDNADPWAFDTRWYEARKRALTLACLPAARYRSAYEPGCANGVLSAALATRCDALLVSDGSDRPLALARERLRGLPNVTVRKAWLPAQWPAGPFDLVVLSEIGYYLGRDGLAEVASRALASLQPGGTVLACHWRAPIEGCALDGDAVHALLAQQLDLPLLASHAEPDLRLDVWCADARSVAQREGLR